MAKYKFQPDYSSYTLSSPASELEPTYDVIVIGSGYGGSIAVSRAARAGQKVCLLEKGKEWKIGDFPEKELSAIGELQMTVHDKKRVKGNPTSLYDIIISPDVAILQGSGLGGTSLINANVGLDCETRIFEDEVWPQAFRDDLDQFNRVDRKRVYDMLKPKPFPEFHLESDNLPKLNAMETAAKHIADIEDLETRSIFKRPPLYVNFANTDQNHVGIAQPACINCGNCCGGCNTGAKNSLNMNYLPDAKAHGAKMFTMFEITHVSRNTDKDVWRVHYICHDKNPSKGVGPFVEAKVVILGGGSIGTTNILLQSQTNGIELSSNVGKRFSTNGDTIGFSYNGETKIRPAGQELSTIRKKGKGPGPCITSVIDLRGLPGKELHESYVIQDGTPPSSVDGPYKFLLRWVDSGTDTTPGEDEWREFGRHLSGKGWKNSLAFLSMSHEDATGELRLDEKNGRVWVHYPNVGEGENFKKVKDGMTNATRALKGSFVANPFWGGFAAKFRDTKGIITVHPLGGCVMAENGSNGVVNHAGQVYKGDTDELHPGLYVVDGAVMPRCLGVNPSMTISVVAERCMRLMALQHGWNIDYDSKKMISIYNTSAPS
ncbi:cholesterol oxidase-like [Amphiura filiformis]|uniref:cholesterol oxidase-like n=1 Tax=Amphiura filiformis TaxID=82378 RepID=UPI003B2249A7